MYRLITRAEWDAVDAAVAFVEVFPWRDPDTTEEWTPALQENLEGLREHLVGGLDTLHNYVS